MRVIRWHKRWCTVLGSTVVLVGVIASSAAATESSSAPGAGEQATGTRVELASTAVPGIDPEIEDQQASVQPDSDAQPAWWCTPDTRSDNPHVTRGDVSGHGWWFKGDCSNNRAVVTVCLQQYYTDGTHRTKECNDRTIAPGSSRRANARTACTGRALTTWRNVVDVDVVGEADAAEQDAKYENISCRVD